MEILIILVFAFGYVFGWLGHARSITKTLTENPDEMIRILTEYKRTLAALSKETVVDNSVQEITVEVVKGTVYLYAKDTGQFIAQGSTMDQAVEAAKKRFPGKAFRGVAGR